MLNELMRRAMEAVDQVMLIGLTAMVAHSWLAREERVRTAEQWRVVYGFRY